jgi:MFS family permease
VKDYLPPALLNREFRLFWTGGALSAFGSQFTTVAMAWQIYELTGSALQVGLLGLGRALPQMGLALFGGLLADTFDRRRLMMAVQLAQCLISAGLAAATFAGVISPSVLFVASVLFAFGTALETPSRQAIVPNLVPPGMLSSAIALNSTQRSVAMIAGPSLGGVTLAVSGPEWCYVVDSASWFVMLACLALIRKPLQVMNIASVSMEALLAGVRFVLTQQVILAFMILDFGATFFGSTTALLPIYAKDILEVGPIGLGVLYAAPSLGAVAAGVGMSIVPSVDKAGKWVLIGIGIYGICTIGFALSRSLPLSILMLAGTGAGNAVSAVLRGTSNQLLTADQLRGRVAAVNSVFVQGGPQLGQFESGAIASLGGATLSGVTGGLGALLLAGAIALLPRVRAFRLSGSVRGEEVLIQK